MNDEPKSGRRTGSATLRPTHEEAALSLGMPNYLRVRDAIRADIARGDLPGGMRLKIIDLTARYRLSPAPIREALNQLETEGWIVIAPNRGASVRIIDETFLLELNEIRLALESYIVRLAAEVATPEDVDRLERIQEEYEANIGRRNVQRLLETNARFHQAILAIRPNQEAMTILRRHDQFFRAMRQEWGYRRHRPQEIAAEHRAVLSAMRANDGAEAERLLRDHIQHAIEDLLARRKGGAS